MSLLFLIRFYNVEFIFSQEGGNRHKHILKVLKDIVIYEIYERHTREQNAVAMRRYQEAMSWLEKLNTGEFSDHTLPVASEDDSDLSGDSGDVRFGGNKQYKSQF